MRAVILAGGATSRLAPLNRDRPDALLTVANRPVIEHVIEMLARHGVDAATVALHHCPYAVEATLGNGTRFGLSLDYALERVYLGSAGTARRIARSWTEPFVLASGAAWLPANLREALAEHHARDAALTLIVASRTLADGILDVADDGRVLKSRRVTTGAPALAALSIVSPTALRLVPRPEQSIDLVADLLPRLIDAGLPVYAHVTSGPAVVVTSFADLLRANQRALAGKLPGLVLPGVEIEPGIRVCHGAIVHPRVGLVAPVLVGANAVIDRDAVVAGAAIGDDVIVDRGSTIHQSIVTSRTHVGGGLHLELAVVTPDGIGHARPGTGPGRWIDVRDPCLLDDTRAPLTVEPRSAVGRLSAAIVLGLAAPLWGLVLLALLVESGGRPFHDRTVVGARGRLVRLRSIAARGPCGRTLARWGLKRLPYLWSIFRGDLHWVGTFPRAENEIEGLQARGEPHPVSPGLVTLAQFAGARLRRDGRLALDRLYAATRCRSRDVRLLTAAVLGRVGVHASRAIRSGKVTTLRHL